MARPFGRLIADECQNKYGNPNAWRYCTEVFDLLAVAALIDGKTLCVHGGLSPDVTMLDQVRLIDRNQEIPHEGAFCDLVWSDPDDLETWAMSPRGAGYLFGAKVTDEVRAADSSVAMALAGGLRVLCNIFGLLWKAGGGNKKHVRETKRKKEKKRGRGGGGGRERERPRACV